MKTALLTISLLMFSHAAMAMHAYGEDSCVAQTSDNSTLKIQLANGEPADPHIIIDQDNSDIRYDVAFQGSAMGNDEGNSGDLVLKSKGDTHIVSKRTSDGCFEGAEATSAREAVVLSVSKTLAEKYGLKKGQVLNFSCFFSDSAPTGKHCQ